MIKIRPQVMTAMAGLIAIAMVVIFVAPEHLVEIVGGCVTGIGMLAMKVIEDKD